VKGWIKRRRTEVIEATGHWTGRGLCLIGRVRSVLSVCACLGILIGRGGASSRCESLLDSNRTLALWRSVWLAARSVAVSLECCSGLTSVSGPLRDLRVRSSFARPVNSTSVSGRASRMGGVRTCASGPRDQHVRSARLQLFQVPNGYIRRVTFINTRWPAQGSISCTLVAEPPELTHF
jgi:hypothetical protein